MTYVLDEVMCRRVVFITGKGGVGKTSVAAALAYAAAARGKKVLLTEIAVPGDDYSPLANLFGRHQLPRVAEELVPGVHGVILLAQVGQELFARTAIKSKTLVKAVLSSNAIQQFLRFTPSCRELGIYYHLYSMVKRVGRGGRLEYDMAIVDMPSTGHALALTSLPKLLLTLFRRGPVARAIADGQSVFNCPDTTKAFVVTLPETLPVSEAIDLLNGLRQTNISAGGVILNRVIPNIFTDTELRALRGALDGQHILGSESLYRLETSQRAAERLAAATTLPLTRIRNVASGNVVEEMVRELGRNHQQRGPSNTVAGVGKQRQSVAATAEET